MDNESVLRQLKRREPIFHRREFGTSRQALENMMTSSFWEVGASGKIYQRDEVIDILLSRYAEQPIDQYETEQWETHNFDCQHIAANSYLLTYTLKQGARRTRRVTIWQHENKTWKIAYHQGTIVI